MDRTDGPGAAESGLGTMTKVGRSSPTDAEPGPADDASAASANESDGDSESFADRAHDHSSELEFQFPAMMSTVDDAGLHSAAEIADHDVIFRDSEFQQLRDRLFGDHSPYDFRLEPAVSPPAPAGPAEPVQEVDDVPDPWTHSTPTARMLMAEDSFADDEAPELPMLPVGELLDVIAPPSIAPDETVVVGNTTAVSLTKANAPENLVAAIPEPRAPEPEPEPAVVPTPGPAADPPIFIGVIADGSEETSPGRQRWLAPVAVLALMLGLVVAGIVWMAGDRSGTTAPEANGSAPDGRGEVAASPGASSQVTLGPHLTLNVSQHVILEAPTRAVTVSLPDRSGLSALDQFSPQATGVRVVVDGVDTAEASAPINPGDTVTIDLPTATADFRIEYTALGAVERSVPSTANRAAVLADVLAVDGDLALPVTTAVEGATNMGCVMPSGTTACGSETDDGWQVVSESGEQPNAVIAQVNLPE